MATNHTNHTDKVTSNRERRQVEVPENTWKRVKSAAALLGEGVSQFTVAALEERLKSKAT